MKDICANVSNSTLQLLCKRTGKVLETLPIVEAKNEHRNFIISTWVRSSCDAARGLFLGPAGLRIDLQAFRAGESKVAERMWSRCRCVVSGSPEDNQYTVYAYICAEEGRLWHVYVAPDLRGLGIATGLIQELSGPKVRVYKPGFPGRISQVWDIFMVGY